MDYDNPDDLVTALSIGEPMSKGDRAIAEEIRRLRDRVSELEQQAAHPDVARVAAALDHAKEGI